MYSSLPSGRGEFVRSDGWEPTGSALCVDFCTSSDRATFLIVTHIAALLGLTICHLHVTLMSNGLAEKLLAWLACLVGVFSFHAFISVLHTSVDYSWACALCHGVGKEIGGNLVIFSP